MGSDATGDAAAGGDVQPLAHDDVTAALIEAALDVERDGLSLKEIAEVLRSDSPDSGMTRLLMALVRSAPPNDT